MMSALPQEERSNSTTAEATGDISRTKDTIEAANPKSPLHSSSNPPLQMAAPDALADLSTQTPPEGDNTMTEAIPTPDLLETIPQVHDILNVTKDSYEDHSDTRSSSLSELGEGLDDQDELTPQAHTTGDIIDDDSEAETERLEKTPRKLLRTATDTSIMSELTVERTPSKLANAIGVDDEGSGPQSPLAALEETTVTATTDGETAIHSVSIITGSDNGSFIEVMGRKRKRSTPETGSGEDLLIDEPARKRSDTGKDDAVNGQADLEPDADEGPDNDEMAVSHPLEDEVDLQRTVTEAAEEAVEELAAVAKIPPKPRKGKRKGRKQEEAAGSHAEPVANNEGVDNVEVNEVDHDDEEGSGHDEEAARKRAAIDSLGKIEKKFKIFREKWCEESLAQLNKELDMLKQPNCTHPEYLAMIQCVDERRAEKIEYEKRILEYKQQNLEIKTNAERHQMQSQYLQTVRSIRQKMLSECNERIYQIQRGRRQLGVDETEYSFKFPEKRSTQIQQQAAYNLEVSILSGVAKYVGFPAAPEITAARPSEIEDDLRAMKINTRPAQAPTYVRPYNRPSRADEAAAEEQFIEQTPWANPQHPAHQQPQYQGGPPSRVPSQNYSTPAAQRRIVDVHAPNGSASTIEMISNPPSSAAAQGQAAPDSAQRNSESLSPVLQMKRNPSEQRIPLDTPARTFANTARDPYTNNTSLGPSPASEQGHEDRDIGNVAAGARWGGASIRSSNAATPSRLQEQSQGVGARPDSARPPLSQRSGLGTVSVGTAGVFGR